MNNLYIYLGIYITVLLIISYIVSRKETSEGFLISGRNRSGWQILLSKFSVAIGVSWFITYTAYAYEFGIGVFLMLVGFIIGYFLFAYWAGPKIYKDSKENKFYTIGDFVYHKTRNNFSKIITNAISIIYSILWISIGIIGGAKAVSYFGLFPYEIAVLITSGIVLIYILLAGYQAVIITDVFQSFIILFLLGFLSFEIIKSESIITVLNVNPNSATIGAIIGLFLYGIATNFASADRYQLCYASKDEKNMKIGMSFAIFPILLVAFFLLLIGLFVYLKNPNLDSSIVFLEALKTYLPATLIPISFVMFFAGLMSSVDSGIYAAVSHYIFSKKTENPVKEIRYLTILLTIIIVIIAYFFRSIVDISVLAGAITLILSIPMIYLLLGKTNPKRFIGSVFGGIIGVILGISFIGLDPSAAIFVFGGSLFGLLYNRK